VGCGLAGNLARVNVLNANGPSADLSGIDLSSEYRWDDLAGGAVTLGLDATYNIEYKVADTVQFGITTAKAFDGVGQFNSGTAVLSLPQWRAQASVDYERGNHTLRWQVRYSSKVFDQRAGNKAANDLLAQIPGYPTGTIATAGVNVGAWVEHDLYYRWRAPWQTTLNLSLLNVFDKDPPLARNELSYDTFNANPLGRVFKIGLAKQF
jgi:iron complex outermembrane receptor protein